MRRESSRLQPPFTCLGVVLDTTCVYFTFLHLVSYLTINQQFGHEATESHSGQRQVIIGNGQAF